MTTMTITLIVAIVVAITLYSVTLREVIKKGYSGRRIAYLILPLGLLFIIYLSFNLFKIEPADWAQIILTSGLVGITIFYAFSATRQADASVKMAEEMKEQRYSESLPLLVPDIIPSITVDPNEVPYESLQAGIGIKVVWHNVGKGVAANSTFSLWGAPLPSGEVHHFLALESRALGSGQQITTSFDVYSTQKDKPERYQPRLEAEYQDIYERKVTTVQEFRIEEENENKRAFLGDLYFTVNGKRLGEEKASHD
jgi:hypothetical protein